jgi:MscS family membrane protein
MDYSTLDQVFLGNTLKSYLLFAGILIVGLLFKRIFSRLLSFLLFKLFGRLIDKSDPRVFISLLMRPVELLLLFFIIYLAINQLNYPLQEGIFSRETLTGKVKTL